MDIISCPKCGTEIKLTESLAAPLVEELKDKYEKQLAERQTSYEEKLAHQEANIKAREEVLEREQETINQKVADTLEAEKEKLRNLIEADLIASAAQERQAREKALAETQLQLADRDAKLKVAQDAQAAALRKERELEEKTRELELEVERRVTANVSAIRTQAEDKVRGEERLKLAEKEEVIASMQRKIEDLKQKAEQGSQQLQGEVQELILESTLREAFPYDTIEPVPKGVHGGDTLQVVNGPRGPVGTILWESKRTKTFSQPWLSKLRDDQRTAGAEVAVLITTAMPRDMEVNFGLIDGVWVLPPAMAVPVSSLLRQGLLDVATARVAHEGQETKTELVYAYLTGPQFRHRVEAIVEAFSMMQDDLEKERRAITKQWSKRDQQLTRMMTATTGMYGDLQGIAGQSLLEIEGLSLSAPALESGYEPVGGRARLSKRDVPD